MIKLNTKDIKLAVADLRAGDMVSLSGIVYTARDAAHSKIAQILREGGQLPFTPAGAVIYYAGPTPAPDNRPIGSIGPTTSGRMDEWTPTLLDLGVAAMIGKGQRNAAVNGAIIRNCAPYFIAVGGAGALYAKYIKYARVIAFEELGCEAIRELTIEDFPVFVGTDCVGGTVFSEG